MQRLALWLIPLIASGVVLFLILFLISINSESTLIQSRSALINIDTNVTLEKPSIWVDSLSKNERLGYTYPVNEIYLDLDLSKKIIDINTYRLTANIKDPYQLFCIKQELKNLNLRYSLKNDNNKVELLIVSKKMSHLKTLVKSLENYQIKANILLIKKESK